MIADWLDLPSLSMFAALALLYAITGTAIACVGLSRLTKMPRFEGVVAPFFGVVSVLFALLTGFLASDIADRNRQAARAVQTEASELRNIHTLSVASASSVGSIRAALAAYVETLVNDEWPAMAADREAPAASAAYDELVREVSNPKIAQETGTAVHTALLNAAVRAGTARSDRLALAADRTSDIKWVLVLVLGIMTQLSIALVHLQKRNALIATLTVFSVAAVLALGLIGLQERPFAGDVRVPPGPLEEVAKLPAQ
jgi:hypothetical protein